MLSLLRDVTQTWQLQARYRRLVQKQLLELAESESHVTADADHDAWRPASGAGLLDHRDASKNYDALRERARELVNRHPYATNLLRLLEIYVAGPGLQISHRANVCHSDPADETLAAQCQELWQRFVDANAGHWSFREHARRAWRDGETFVRKFPPSVATSQSSTSHDDRELVSTNPHQTNADWPPQVRFVEPGQIAPTPTHPATQGVLTTPGDVEVAAAYLHHATSHSAQSQSATTVRQTVTTIPAAEMHHTRYGVDSNERRGRSLLAPVIQTLDAYDRWLDTELQARRLQASIVLWRKVHGRPAVDGDIGSDGVKRERVRPGTIVTTSPGTELEFLQPKTNFGDAVGLGRQLLLAISAGIGVPEYMLTADASNANFASTMVAEGPAVKLFQSLQQWLADDLTRLWRWVLVDAIDAALLPADVFDRVRPDWTFPTLVARDRPAERMADVALLDHGVLSRAEVARRDGVDPAQMDIERERDATTNTA